MPLPERSEAVFTSLKVHPMMPVFRAASLLAESVDSLENKLAQGEIRGEKRRISEQQGGKYSWFIYACDFETLLEERTRSCQARLSTEGLEQLFDARSGEVLEGATEVEIEAEVIFEDDAKITFETNLEEPLFPATIGSTIYDEHFECAANALVSIAHPPSAFGFGQTNALISERKEQEINQQLTRRVGELENEVQRLHEEMSQLRIEILGRDWKSGSNKTEASGIFGYFQTLKKLFTGKLS